MATDNRYQEAAALTTKLDLPQETALPAQRKRNHSLIPKELMNPSEGGMERAALATVFGVREYTEPKVLWERQLIANNNEDAALVNTSNISQEGYISITGKSVVSNPLASTHTPNNTQRLKLLPSQHNDTVTTQQSIASYVASALDTVGQNQFKTTMPTNNNNNNNNTATFNLPDIPVVSKFDDWLTTSSKATIIYPPSLKPTTLIDQQQQQQQQRQQHDTKWMDLEIAPPLVFLSYPPAIFDLLKSDTDDRIIIWGPDPQVIPASEATNLSSSIAIMPQQKPSTMGFSSNTTATSSVYSEKSDQGKKKLRSKWINKMKQSIQSSTLDSSNNIYWNEKDYDEKKTTLRARFGRRSSSTKQKHTNETVSTSSSTTTTMTPKVIEAATVEKLVEKLTVTLDYTFMTDFFLTYRTFLSPIQLCKLLILRFRWGLENNEDDRCIVRIRTFVVIRHWLLNYFVHDFTPSRELREILTVFLNTLPSHPSIKNSPRDQRIVKGLKRVVRRLKKVHYPRSSQHVQVISPPPPLYDEQQVRNMLHAKLSQSPLRRKTEELIQKGMEVEDRHHGNVAFQDARHADIVVIGSSDKSPLPPSSTPVPPIPEHDQQQMIVSQSTSPLSPASYPPTTMIGSNGSDRKRNRNVSQNSIAKYATSAFSISRLHPHHNQQELQKAKVKESYLRRMEQEKRLMQQQLMTTSHDHDIQNNGNPIEQSSTITDASLESLVSPGTTDDELYDDTDDDDDDDDDDGNDDDSGMDNDDLAMENKRPQICPVPGTTPGQPSIRQLPSNHRRSVYNAELCDLSPIALPNGSFIHATTTTYSPDNAIPVLNQHISSSLEKPLPPPLQLETTTTTTTEPVNNGKGTTSNDQRRISWNNNNNRISKSYLEETGEKTALESPVFEDKTLMESPTSITSDSTQRHSSSNNKPQRKLSQRLIKAFRAAGSIRSTKATVIQPKMTSTAPSSVSHSSVVVPQTYESSLLSRQTAPPHNDTTWNQSNLHQLEDLRTSLDEILPPAPDLPSKEHHQQRRMIELDIPRWGSSHHAPASLSQASFFRSSMVLQYRSHDLAQQLCLVERGVLLQVNWEEMVHCRWTKMANLSTMMEEDEGLKMDSHQDDNHATYYSRQTRQLQLMRGEQEGGVQQLIKRFNTVCQWVSSEIVRTPVLDDRVLVIEKFIRLAQKCQVYSNFATLVQILLGLQSPSVSRLRKTWARVSDTEMRLLEQLSSFTSPMKNWKHIRDNMTLVADEYGMSPKEVQIQLPGSIDRQLNKPKIKLPFGGCIPFLGLYLSDLVFNSEQPSYLEPSHDHHKIYQSYTKQSTTSPLLRQPLVNFRKYRIIATIIKRILTFQDLASRYSFEQLDPLYTSCLHLDALDTDTIRQLSLTIEPPPLSSS